MKPILILTLFFALGTAHAQSGIKTYYLKNSGRQVASADSADVTVKVTPPGREAIDKVFIVEGYDVAGNMKFSVGSLTGKPPFVFQGARLEFFSPGKKKQLSTYSNGVQRGDVIAFYPNGNFYFRKTVGTDSMGNSTLLFEDCRDSTGKVLATGGAGYWTTYNDHFDEVVAEGKIANGHQVGMWTMQSSGAAPYAKNFSNGVFPKNNDTTLVSLVSVDYAPEFPGGSEAFYQLLGKSIKYPALARERSVEGRVIVVFIIEKDGSLSGIHVARGIGAGCDQEAVRVISLSPKWKPGIKNGSTVRVQYTLPIYFKLPRY